MSEETQIQQQEPDKPTQSYISRVRLKGYKSIIDTEVTFKPGLNIIIGANGSGKTNFVEFLDIFLNAKFEKSDNLLIESEGIVSGRLYKYFFQKSFTVPLDIENSKNLTKYNFLYKVNKEDKLPKLEGYFDDYYLKVQVETLRAQQEFLNSPVFIRFNIPSIYNRLSSFFNFKYEKGIKFESDFDSNEIGFFNLMKLIIVIHLNKTNDQKIFKENFLEYFSSLIAPVKQFLKTFSPIKDIRINPSFSFSIKDNIIELKNVVVEFFIDEAWMGWNNISDGTKRLFYIITEAGNIDLGNEKVILLEEPELGIHPDQLRKLMSFLREQAEEKQIIITTHSPQVLNALKSDELDRIIVARYEKEAGTKLYHLTEEEIEHARSYMQDEGLFLSDYWVYSGFEKEEEEV